MQREERKRGDETGREVLKKGKEVMVMCRFLINIALFICACGKKVESLYKFIGMRFIINEL